MTPNKRYVISGLIVLGTVLVVLVKYWDYVDKPWTRDAPVQPTVIQINPPVSGPITKVAVVNNQAVKAGDLLIEIDPRTYQSAVNEASTEDDLAGSADPTSSDPEAGPPGHSGTGVALTKHEETDPDQASSKPVETDLVDASSKAVETDLADANQFKPAIFPIDLLHSRLGHFYLFKDRVKDTLGLAFNIDYSVLAQHASFTKSGKDTGASGVFRILGTWLRVGTREGDNGHLVWKMETRNHLGNHPTPRDLGFDTGSALSTANYKELDYWGITDLYWHQRFNGGKYGLLAGHMDPGDWADQYPLLNAWTSFMNDAFYNNPTQAIPKRGFGLVGQVFMDNNLYIMGGVHDANGKDGKLDFSSLWNTREWFSYAEFGFRSSRRVGSRHNAHINVWRQDAREEAEVEESHGVVGTYSYANARGGVSFVRAGWSKGDAAQMRRFIGAGLSFKPRDWGTLGIASSWGSPPDKALRNQITTEVFYRVQLTQNLTFTPSLQATYNPSFTQEKTWVMIPGLRMRLVF